MRIARGEHVPLVRPPLVAFRVAGVMSPAEVLAHGKRFGPIAGLPPLADTWRSLAEQLLARLKRGETRYGLLQRGSLWFEHAWYAAHEGDIDAASGSLTHLETEISGLPARDKAFFSKARDSLPLELVA